MRDSFGSIFQTARAPRTVTSNIHTGVIHRPLPIGRGAGASSFPSLTWEEGARRDGAADGEGLR